MQTLAPNRPCWDSELHQPQSPSSQPERVQGPAEKGELELRVGGRMRRWGPKGRH